MARRPILLVIVAVLLAGMAGAIVLWVEGSPATGQATGPTPPSTFTPIVAPASPSPGGLPLADPSDPGYRLYLRDCAWCHGNQAAGTARGPGLVGVGAASADFQLGTGRMPLTKVEEQPERKTPRYDRAQIRDIDGFVASLGAGPEIPSVDPAAGDLRRGLVLYQANCAACHSSTGAGGALTSGQLAPALGLATATQIGEAIRLGPGTMPAFGPGSLPTADVNSIARYLVYLRHPDDRGGAPLGRAGPVTEGLVGLVVGLGALLLVTRWIGTRW